MVGKANVVAVVEVIDVTENAPVTSALRQGFAAALEIFLTERWEAAAAAFAELASRFPNDRVSMFYLDICRTYASGGAPESEPTRLTMTEK